MVEVAGIFRFEKWLFLTRKGGSRYIPGCDLYVHEIIFRIVLSTECGALTKTHLDKLQQLDCAVPAKRADA